MYVTVVHGPTRPATVFGPIDDRHPPVTPGVAQAATNLPLYSAGAIVDSGGLSSRIKRVSRATADAIANAIPVTGQIGPAVLLAVDPDPGLVVAVGPIATAELAGRWLRERGGLAGERVRWIALPLVTPASAGADR